MVQFDHFLYICQAEAETLYIVLVTSVYPVELVEDALQVVLLNADAIVGDADADVRLVLVVGMYLDGKWFFLTAILEGIVQQIEDDVGEVHLVDVDNGVLGIELAGDGAAKFSHLELEGVDYAVDDGVGPSSAGFVCLSAS